MSLDTMMSMTADVYRVVTVKDGLGSFTETEQLQTPNMACRLNMASGNEREEAGQRGVNVTHVMYCRAQNTPVVEKDVIKRLGKTYDIQLVELLESPSGWIYTKVWLLERRRG